MTKFAILSTSLAATFVALPASPAQALDVKTFVSSTGSGLSCTRATPCNSFATAHDATVAGGEINCLDSGPFGGATITKSITIDCAGMAATALFMAVNAAGIAVTIRNVSINGAFGVGAGSGIDFQNGAALLVENCVIQNFTGGAGITFRPAADGSQLVVSDTVLSNNGSGTTGGGIMVKPSSPFMAHVALNRVTVAKNAHGIIADGTGGSAIRGVVRDSVVSGNAYNGITVSTAGGR